MGEAAEEDAAVAEEGAAAEVVVVAVLTAAEGDGNETATILFLLLVNTAWFEMGIRWIDWVNCDFSSPAQSANLILTVSSSEKFFTIFITEFYLSNLLPYLFLFISNKKISKFF